MDVIHLMYLQILGNLSHLLCSITTMDNNIGWEGGKKKRKRVLQNDICMNQSRSLQLIRRYIWWLFPCFSKSGGEEGRSFGQEVTASDNNEKSLVEVPW